MHDKGIASIINTMNTNPLKKQLGDSAKIDSDEDPVFNRTIKRHHKKTIPNCGEY